MTELGHISRDWKLVVIRKKAPTAAAHKDEKTVNAARRADAEIKTIRKANAASNKAASSSTTLNTRKLDDETERTSSSFPLKLMPRDVPNYKMDLASLRRKLLGLETPSNRSERAIAAAAGLKMTDLEVCLLTAATLCP
ncbi:hypothetical protein TEA_005200 [Camellia sinensis var. sinensis]|uniref:Multiprotein bridging factor 1 N-terminal domain-containing protein n=1 Tax=Camellia sinensis var. sinensis TaxID=542762 RepID=A0A4S4EUF0_CAMSN|nr:hypothetical protein TEA_005200 [Camellia sinensis var. sinensis]